MEEVFGELAGVITHFPWGTGAGIFAYLVLGLIFFVVFILPNTMCRKYPAETAPLEVPEGISAWTISRHALWTRYYRSFWGRYPRDICSYFWLSLVLGALSVILGVSCFTLSVAVISMIFWLAYGIGFLIYSSFTWIPQIPAFLLWVISTLFNGIMHGGYVIATVSVTYKIIGICLGIVMVYAFFRSNAWKVTRLWASAKKNKFCPRIRIV